MGEKTLNEYLERITKDELVKKMKIAGLKYTGLDKIKIAGILYEYLQDEQNIGRIWSSLSPFEKEYLDEFLKYDERPAYKKLEGMYQKYAMKGSYFREPWEEQSKMSVFFIGKSVPPQIKRSLKEYLTPIIVKYDAVEQPPADSKNCFNTVGESFAQDFCGVIHLVKNVKLSLTKEKRVPSKSAVVKIDSVLSNKDFVFEYIGGIDNVRGIESTNRVYGIFMLLAESGLICENGDIMSITGEAEAFLKLRLENKCGYLFKHYLKSRRIYEVGRIVESGYKTECMGNMAECRNVVIKHLKTVLPECG